MKIGIPKEIISQEYRVSVNPETAKILLQSSHELYIQSGAGVNSGYSDYDYSAPVSYTHLTLPTTPYV